MRGPGTGPSGLSAYRLAVRGALLLLIAAWTLTLLRFPPELIAIFGLLGRATAGLAGVLRLLMLPARQWRSPPGLVIVVGVILLATGGVGRLLDFSSAIPEAGAHNPLPTPDLLIVLAMVVAERPASGRE